MDGRRRHGRPRGRRSGERHRRAYRERGYRRGPQHARGLERGAPGGAALGQGHRRDRLGNPGLQRERYLEQITHDHTYVQSLVDIGAISAADAHTHPDRSILTQCLGSLSLEEVNVGQIKGTFYRDHKLLLCSDGLTGEVSEDAIAETLRESRDDQVAVDRMIISALVNGGSDNVTVILISALDDAPVSPLLETSDDGESEASAN